MAVLLLFAIFIFTCGVVNSLYFSKLPAPSPSRISAWLRSLLRRRAIEEADDNTTTKKKKTTTTTSCRYDDDLVGVFSTFDKDGDGFITAGELEESLGRLGIAVAAGEVAGMMEKVDSNGDGLLDLDEFRALYETLGGGGGDGGRRSSGSEEDEEEEEEEEDDDEGEGEMDLKEAFDVFDRNKDGLITVEELGMVLESLGLRRGATAGELKDMIRKVDVDGDGKVDFGEFKKMMTAKNGRLF